jgi:hypothetical protein
MSVLDICQPPIMDLVAGGEKELDVMCNNSLSKDESRWRLTKNSRA